MSNYYNSETLIELENKVAELQAENLVLKEENERMMKALHYPKCWDTMAYPTACHAINELFDYCHTCSPAGRAENDIQE